MRRVLVKTQTAYWIAWKLNLGSVLEFQVKSTSVSRDLIYEFEAVRYMAAAMRKDELPPRSDFILHKALWDAFVSDHPRVLLVDEIDKAAPGIFGKWPVAAREFDQWVIEIEEARESNSSPALTIPSPPERRPIVIITSNGERPLPDPILRRCVFHNIELGEADIRKIFRARRDSGDFQASDELIDWASKLENQLRGKVDRPPGVAELLSWLGLLDLQKIRAIDPNQPLPNIDVLLKTREDMERGSDLMTRVPEYGVKQPSTQAPSVQRWARNGLTALFVVYCISQATTIFIDGGVPDLMMFSGSALALVGLWFGIGVRQRMYDTIDGLRRAAVLTISDQQFDDFQVNLESIAGYAKRNWVP